MDYDANGRVSASWDDYGGGSTDVSFSGTPFTTAIYGNCIVQNSLSTVYGANLRTSNCPSEPDPRQVSYQIDATCNSNGEYSFSYADPYGQLRYASSTSGTPNGKVYSVACGAGIISQIIGSAAVSSRPC
jgi:hypothetical protein